MTFVENCKYSCNLHYERWLFCLLVLNSLCLQHQANTEKGFKVREQVCKASKEGKAAFSGINFDRFHCNHFQASEFSIRTQLKTVKKKEFAMDEGEAEARPIHFVHSSFISFNKMGRRMLTYIFNQRTFLKIHLQKSQVTQQIMLKYSCLSLMFFTLVHAQGDVSAILVQAETV